MNLQEYVQLNVSSDGTTYYIERLAINGQLCTTITENIEDVVSAAFVARVCGIAIQMTKEVLRDIRAAR